MTTLAEAIARVPHDTKQLVVMAGKPLQTAHAQDCLRCALDRAYEDRERAIQEAVAGAFLAAAAQLCPWCAKRMPFDLDEVRLNNNQHLHVGENRMFHRCMAWPIPSMISHDAQAALDSLIEAAIEACAQLVESKWLRDHFGSATLAAEIRALTPANIREGMERKRELR